jgi:hypothetical protein
MDAIYFRVGAILAHVILNIIIISWIVNFDITASWLRVAGFAALLFILLVLFIKHLISFINYLKTKTK